MAFLLVLFPQAPGQFRGQGLRVAGDGLDVLPRGEVVPLEGDGARWARGLVSLEFAAPLKDGRRWAVVASVVGLDSLELHNVGGTEVVEIFVFSDENGDLRARARAARG